MTVHDMMKDRLQTCGSLWQLDVDQRFADQCDVIHVVVESSDNSIVATGDRDRRLVTLYLAYTIKLFHRVTNTDKPVTADAHFLNCQVVHVIRKM